MKIINTIFLSALPKTAGLNHHFLNGSKRMDAIRKNRSLYRFPQIEIDTNNEDLQKHIDEQTTKIVGSLAWAAYRARPELGKDWADRRPTYPTGLHASLRIQLLVIKCQVTNIYRAMASRSYDARETGFFHLNTAHLAFFRLLTDGPVQFPNHKETACSDHFIPHHERAYGKRKTGAALKRAQEWHKRKLAQAAKKNKTAGRK
jgi:hypothetical protein